MTAATRQFVHGFVFALGVVLIVGGVATGQHGAWIVGLIVAAVDFRAWQRWNRQRTVRS